MITWLRSPRTRLARSRRCVSGFHPYPYAQSLAHANQIPPNTGPPVKRKAIESHPSFAKFLGQSNGDATASTSEAPKLTAAPKSRKRKPADETPEEPAKSEPDSSEPDKTPTK